MDNETEIQEAISKPVKGKTVLVIAHRMRTVENADKIVVLDGGVVAESGTHDEKERTLCKTGRTADGFGGLEAEWQVKVELKNDKIIRKTGLFWKNF